MDDGHWHCPNPTHSGVSYKATDQGTIPKCADCNCTGPVQPPTRKF